MVHISVILADLAGQFGRQLHNFRIFLQDEMPRSILDHTRVRGLSNISEILLQLEFSLR